MLRAWQDSDIDKIAELENACFKDPWSLNTLKSAFNSPVFYGLVDEVDGEILGYLAMNVVLDEASVDDIAIKKEHRKQGLAKKMLSLAENELKARGVNKIFLEVRRFNEPAIKLYETLGFVVIAERLKYYGDEDALIMQKNI